MALLTQNVGIVGATGVVGRELLALFEEQNIRPAELKLLASKRSVGTKISVHND